jgi:hypothetical protein
LNAQNAATGLRPCGQIPARESALVFIHLVTRYSAIGVEAEQAKPGPQPERVVRAVDAEGLGRSPTRELGVLDHTVAAIRRSLVSDTDASETVQKVTIDGRGRVTGWQQTSPRAGMGRGGRAGYDGGRVRLHTG